MKLFKTNVEKEERLALQKEELDAFRSEMEELRQQIRKKYTLHRNRGEIRSLLERNLPYTIGLLKSQDYTRYRRYSTLIEEYVTSFIEQSLIEWVQLDEPEKEKAHVAEMLAGRTIGIQERLEVRIGKYIKDTTSCIPNDRSDESFANYLVLHLCLIHSNTSCLDFVKQQEIDALAGFLKVLEMIDLLDARGYGLLMVKVLIYSNISFVLRSMGKLADSLIFMHNAAVLFENIEENLKSDDFLTHLASYVITCGLNLRFAEHYFSESSDEADDFKGVPKSELFSVQRFHYQLYRDLYFVLIRLQLVDEAEEALSQSTATMQTIKQEVIHEDGTFQPKIYKKTVMIEKGEPVLNLVTIETAAKSFLGGAGISSAGYPAEEGPLLAVSTKKGLLLNCKCKINESECKLKIFDCPKEKALLLVLKMGKSPETTKQAIAKHSDVEKFFRLLAKGETKLEPDAILKE